MLRACAIAEGAGVPSVAILSSGFVRQGQAIAKALGIPHVPIAEYPGTIPTDTPETRRAVIRDQLAPAVIEALLREGSSSGGGQGDGGTYEPRAVVASGSLDAIHDYFEERLWTDGLPVHPPTIDRVEAFLAHTDRAPDEVLGVLAPEYREATIWSVAVNGVMAGCRPEYMPILIACVEAISDPVFRIQDGGSTPGWEPLIILSGPMVERLSFNSGGGLMRVGPRSNTSVGRFLRLFMRNVAGLRTPPGTTDRGSIGTTFNVALAEDDRATAALGWEPHRVEKGFALDDDVVTVQSMYVISAPVYSTGTPTEHLEALTYILETATGPWTVIGLLFQQFHPLLLLSPSVAGVLAEAGLSKNDVRRYLFENAKVRAHWLEIWPHHTGADAGDLRTLIANGLVPEGYDDSDDPDRLVPALVREEWTSIVVAGDPDRNQSRFYINNHAQGVPISKRVRFRDL